MKRILFGDSYQKFTHLLVTLFFIISALGNSVYASEYFDSTKATTLYGESDHQNEQGPEASSKKTAIVADHNSIKIDQIPVSWVEQAKKDLHIAFGHTSHGRQIISGMLGMTDFKKEPFIYKAELPEDSIDLRDHPFGGYKDLGQPDNKTWAEDTRKYLEKNKDINVVMWSWCGQLSTGNRDYVQTYLDLMESLEKEFPDVTFIYMTGHLDGTGEEGNLARNNKQIRDFCTSRNKVLYDFADIESYNPDGVYFGDKYANDACDYDSNGDKIPDKNWAIEWQNSHVEGVDWYQCEAAHSQPVNANMKASAMWWLLARIAGWDGTPSNPSDGNKAEEMSFEFYAEELKKLNLFRGTEKGFELDRTPTRLEAAAMLVRLLGGEQEAVREHYAHPFKDAEKTWGSDYVGYLYHNSLVKGISDNSYGSDLNMDAVSYVTLLLRVLGYSDSSSIGDFSWDKSLEAARDLGIISNDYFQTLKVESFNRGHMAKLTYLCLGQKLKGGSLTLMEKLF